MTAFLSLLGVLCLICCIPLLRYEQSFRQYNAEALFHTRVQPLLPKGFEAYDLSSSQIFIGRRGRRCEISINNPKISRVHAVLWWDGVSRTFRIAPVISRYPGGRIHQPQVFVNGEPADRDGLPVQYEDTVMIADCKFKLQDTRKLEVAK